MVKFTDYETDTDIDIPEMTKEHHFALGQVISMLGQIQGFMETLEEVGIKFLASTGEKPISAEQIGLLPMLPYNNGKNYFVFKNQLVKVPVKKPVRKRKK